MYVVVKDKSLNQQISSLNNPSGSNYSTVNGNLNSNQTLGVRPNQLNTKGEKDKKSSIADKKEHKCRYCLLPFHIKEYRRRHESINHKFACKTCPLLFTQQLLCDKHEKDCVSVAGQQTLKEMQPPPKPKPNNHGHQNQSHCQNSNFSSSAKQIPYASTSVQDSTTASSVYSASVIPDLNISSKPQEELTSVPLEKYPSPLNSPSKNAFETLETESAASPNPDTEAANGTTIESSVELEEQNNIFESLEKGVDENDNDNDQSDFYETDSDNENNPLGLAQVVYTEPEPESDSDSETDINLDNENGNVNDNGNSTDSDNYQIFKCDYCDNNYLNQRDLEHHVQVIHNKTRSTLQCPIQQKHHLQFTCNYCPLTFPREWLRLAHMQFSHWAQFIEKHQEASSAQTPTPTTPSTSSSVPNFHEESSPGSPFQPQNAKYNLRKSALKKYSHTKSPTPLMSVHTTPKSNSSKSLPPERAGLTVTPLRIKLRSRLESPDVIEGPRLKAISDVELGNTSADDKEALANPSNNTNCPVRNENNKYNCSYCGKEVSSRQYLQVHERIHTGIKPFKCPYKNCRKAFIRKQSMVNHIRVHTGEKPYGCSICGRYFRVITNLYQHTETHGEIDPALKPYRRIHPLASNTDKNKCPQTITETIEPETMETAQDQSTLKDHDYDSRLNGKELPSSTCTTLETTDSNSTMDSRYLYRAKMKTGSEEALSEIEAEQDQETPFSTSGIKIDPQYHDTKASSVSKTICNDNSSTLFPKFQSQSVNFQRQNTSNNVIRSSNFVPLPSTIRQVLDIHVVQYICNICERNFSYRTDAVQHVHSFHNNFNP